MQDEAQDKLFLDQMAKIKKAELTKMLKCYVCKGLLRFAHTLVDCGHTFCQACIFNYIKSFKGKNPDAKCPQCHALIDQNFRKSIIKDIFKQTLIDTVAPEFAQIDQLIIKRVQSLFPEFDFEYIFDQFKSTNFDALKVKTRKKENLGNRLSEKIKEKLGITFETFASMIAYEKNYLEFKALIEEDERGPPKTFKVKPKGERDETFVGINIQLKLASLTVIKLQRFLEKKALDLISSTEQVPPEWIKDGDEKLDIRVYLFVGEQLLGPDDNLQDILTKNKGMPVTYSLNQF